MSKYEGLDSSTLCWDCANACAGCEWSRNHIPVKGWKAEKSYSEEYGDCYRVIECPKFDRDSISSGQVRLTETERVKRILKRRMKGEEEILPFYA